MRGMDADALDALAGDSGGDDCDEGDGGCSGSGGSDCNYAGYRYGLSRGWDSGDGYCDCELDGVYDGSGQAVPSGSTSATITDGRR